MWRVHTYNDVQCVSWNITRGNYTISFALCRTVQTAPYYCSNGWPNNQRYKFLGNILTISPWCNGVSLFSSTGMKLDSVVSSVQSEGQRRILDKHLENINSFFVFIFIVWMEKPERIYVYYEQIFLVEFSKKKIIAFTINLFLIFSFCNF